ncbi:MAG: hypothetical protein WC005_05955, partial [Candidatus Nanopelagicales bacterium]
MPRVLLPRRMPRVSGNSGIRALAIDTPHPWRRAALIAVTAMSLGAIGHSLAGGHLDLSCLVFAFVPILVLARIQASREFGWLTLTSLLLLAQLILH